MYTRIIHIFFALVCLLLTANAFGQIQVYSANKNALSPFEFVDQFFAGKGVEILDVSFEGNKKALGIYRNAQIGEDISEGIVLSTGEIESVNDYNISSPASASLDGADFDCPNLSSMTNGELKDVTKLRIRFIPRAESIGFKYLFASEEYPDFVCSKFNDVFGFFINGPRPGGGSYVNENIAVVTDGLANIYPVSINSVNGGSIGEMGGGGDCNDDHETLDLSYLYHTSKKNKPFVYNGRTVALKASKKVVACEIYEIEIVISDVEDQKLDSAVFLESGTFASQYIDHRVIKPSADGYLKEGCQAIRVEFFTDFDIEQTLPIDYRIITEHSEAALASAGLDYTPFPSNISIDNNTKKTGFNILALEDDTVENEELILIEYNKTSCLLDTIKILIKEKSPWLTDVQALPENNCTNQSYQISYVTETPFDTDPENVFRYQGFRQFLGTPSGQERNTIFDLIVEGYNDFSLSEAVLSEICIDGLNVKNGDLEKYSFWLKSPEGEILELMSNVGSGMPYAVSQDQVYFDKICFSPRAELNINNGNEVLGPIFYSNPKYQGTFLPETAWEDYMNKEIKIAGNWQLIAFFSAEDLPRGISNNENTLEGWHMSLRNPNYLDLHWTGPIGDIAFQDPLNPDFANLPNGEYVLTTGSWSGCEAKDTIVIDRVISPQKPVDFICNAQGTQSVVFSWTNPEQGIVEIKQLDDWIPVSSEVTEFSFINLNPLDVRELSARVNNQGCISDSVTISCRSAACEPPINSTANFFPPSCPENMDGSFIITATGGVSPYTYTLGGVTNTDGFFDNLSAGLHTVTIEDSDDCVENHNIFMPSPPIIFLNTVEIEEINCADSNDGIISIEITNGQGPFSYLWTTETGEISSMDSINVSGFPGWNYIQILDNNGCGASDSIFLDAPDVLEIVDILDQTTCNGQAGGQLNCLVQGGTGPYDFQWDDPLSQNNQLAINLEIGWYRVTVTDSNGCMVIDSAEIRNASGIAYLLQSTDVTCFDFDNGVISLANEPDSLYQFLWSGPDMFTSDLDTITDLMPGWYYVTITNQQNCEEYDSVEILQPLSLPSFTNMDSIFICYHDTIGYIELETTGGSGGIVVFWEDGTIGRENDRLPVGISSVTITDGNGCGIADSVYVVQEDSLYIQTQIVKPSCRNSKDAQISISELRKGSEIIDITNVEIEWNIGIENQLTITDLTAGGTYSVTVTDPEGCSIREEIQVENPPPLEIINIRGDSVSCYFGSDGSLEVETNLGAAPYNYDWGIEANYQAEALADSLTAGVYTVTVTDALDCTNEASFEVFQPQELRWEALVFNALCKDDRNGKIAVLPRGGTPEYSFTWSNGGDSKEIDGLGAGAYFMELEDKNGCLGFDTLIVGEPENYLEIISVDVFDPVCGDETGRIEAFAEGGTGEYVFGTDGLLFGSNETILGLSEGTYRIFVKDENGCIDSSGLNVINASPEVNLDLGPDLVLPFNGGTGLSPNINHAEEPILFIWSTSSQDSILSCYTCSETAIHSLQESTTVFLDIIDVNGCTAGDAIKITVDRQIFIDVPTGFTPNSDGNNDLLSVYGAKDVTVISFEVYDRWGEKVFSDSSFETNDEEKGWNGEIDGDKAHPGLYFWVVEAQFSEGKKEVFYGETTLIR